MFGSDQPSPFDLRFRIGRIPVRVSPWFWVTMALLGSSTFSDDGPEYLLLWVLCGFVSILLHELGHAVAARFYGSPVAITLVAFGGVAEYPYPPRSAWKRIAISAAGPAAGFGLLGIVVATFLALQGEPLESHLGACLGYLFVMNLFWNVLNLLPIWPLDGGKIGREVFEILRARNPDAAIHTVSLVFAGSLAAIGGLAYLRMLPPMEWKPLRLVANHLARSPMLILWMALFAVANYQMLQAYRNRRRVYYEDEDTPPWRR